MGDVLSNLYVDPMIEAGVMKDDTYGFLQVLFHGAVYAYVLFTASGWISEGSELLLLTPAKGLVGSVVLPVLGAVPDGAIILFSGATQKNLSVGVGALAGSTIMLLTLPWFLALLAGRVDLKDGEPAYHAPAGKRLSAGTTYTNSGVGVDASIQQAGKLMLLTCLIPYSIVQIPSWMSGCGIQNCGCVPKDPDFADCIADKSAEARPYALVGLVVAGLLFLAYLVIQYMALDEEDAVSKRRRFKTLIKSLKDGTVGVQILRSEFGVDSQNYGAVHEEGTFFHYAMNGMFKMYNTDATGLSKDNIDAQEIGTMLGDLHFPKSLGEELNREGRGSGGLTKDELKGIVFKWATTDDSEEVKDAEGKRQAATAEAGDDDDEEMPEDIAAEKNSGKQQRMIWMRSIQYMLGGTVIVLIFSDAMCDILSTLGERTGIPSFYVAFILAPLASNASELLAAKAYAEKKTQVTMTISLSSLLGAACMNNTFCLAIFLYQIYSKNLIWEFSAETLSIVFVEVVMACFAFQKVQKASWGFIIVSLFPLSVVLVWALENVVGMD